MQSIERQRCRTAALLQLAAEDLRSEQKRDGRAQWATSAQALDRLAAAVLVGSPASEVSAAG